MDSLTVKIEYNFAAGMPEDRLTAASVQLALYSFYPSITFKVFEQVEGASPEVAKETKSLVAQLHYILGELDVRSGTVTPEGIAALMRAFKN